MPIPAIPPTAVHPTPSQEYKISEHPPGPPSSPGQAPNTDLLAAVARRAGVRPDTTSQSAGPKILPSQPSRPPLETPAPEPATPPKEPAKFIPADEIEPAPAAPPAPGVKPPVEPSAETMKSAPAQLREAYERVKGERDTILAERDLTKKEAAEFRAKLKSYEDRVKTLESVEGRARELEKQVLAYDEQLRIANWTQHPKFHEQYVKPVSDGMQEGISMVKELITTDAEGTQRYGTEQDFSEVLAQPNYALMDKKAIELFGERMSVHVVEQAKKVRQLQQVQARAIKDAGLKSMEWLKARQDEEASARTRARSEFDRVSTELADKYPALYRPAEGDKEAAVALQKGGELARVILEGQPPDMPSDQYLFAVAKAYHRLASWSMHQLKIQRLEGEVATLKARLSAYEKSTPDITSRQHPAGTTDSGGVIVTSADDAHNRLLEAVKRRAGSRS